jgi:hypothetical protein
VNRKLSFPFILRSRLALGALLLMLGLALMAALSRHSFAALALDDYNSYRCATGAADGPVFRVLTLTTAIAPQLADRLCRAPHISRRFSAVEVWWQPRSHLTAKLMVDEQFDLFWNRDHVVYGLLPTARDFYMPLLESAALPLYWVSRTSRPRLDSGYFKDKRVGFLRDTSSQSFFLQPSTALKEAGIELAPAQKRFYDDIIALHEALIAGEVDVISSAPAMLAQLGVEQYHSELLNAAVPSGSWFLRNRWLATGVECDLLALPRDPFYMHRAVEPAVEAACARR